jgi:hypothetical protein
MILSRYDHFTLTLALVKVDLAYLDSNDKKFGRKPNASPDICSLFCSGPIF